MRAVKAEPKPKETVVLVSHGGPTTYALRALSRQKPKGKTYDVDVEFQDSLLSPHTDAPHACTGSDLSCLV